MTTEIYILSEADIDIKTAHAMADWIKMNGAKFEVVREGQEPIGIRFLFDDAEDATLFRLLFRIPHD